jgi:S-adenosylmethionine synthetase
VQDNINIVVRPAPQPIASGRYVEMCEHKGIGHPDTITDAVCEAAACELASVYRKEFDQVLHFNVDKGLLIAGRSQPRFGGGRVIKPPRIIVCGRAANPGGRLDLRAVVTDAVRRYLERNIRADTRAFFIEPAIEEGSQSLQQLFADRNKMVRANDTSFGVGFAPLSTLERNVLQLAATLRSAEFRTAFPAAGDDFKIMGLRTGASRTFTVAVAMIDSHVEDVAHYFDIKRRVREYLANRLGEDCTLHINALDDPGAHDESGLHLTVTGLSAEMGDDGQVGRGNRVNGLITPGRPMSLEAAAGKNPVSHVGKIYSVLAHQLAAAICDQIPEVTDATVQLLSRIGEPLDRPQVVSVELCANGDITQTLQNKVAAVVTDGLARAADLTDRLARGAIPVY